MVGRGVKKNTISAVLYILFIQLFLFGIALADDFVPAYYPTLEVSKLSGEIKIDGELNDSGWENAAKADNFAEHSPGDQTKPPVNTEAFITYDENKLYVAMICYDDPSIIRASFCERDRGIGADDNICLLIDTYGDASWAYELNVNPYGIQADAIWSQNGGEDNSYDLVWESAGKITDSGYQIEWAAYDRDEPCWPCKWGTVTGIRDVRPGKGIEILPSVVGYKAGALSGNGTPGSSYNFLNGKADGDYSLGGKYSVSSNITLEATYNPDFSQVEADAAQIDVNSNFALSLEEKRPFFQEGSDLFKTIFDAVYTRSINNPEYAAKVTARVDRTSIAYLLARDENTPMLLPFEEYSRFLSDGAGKSVSNIIRFRHSIGENSHMGMLMTDRRLDEGGSNTVISADGKLRLFKKYSFDFQGLVTQTTEPNKAWLNDQFRWCDTIVTGIDTTFSDIMFDNNRHTTRLDGEKFWGHAYWAGIHRIRSFGLYHFRFDKGLFERLTPSYMIGHQWNFAKEAKDKFIEFALEGNLRFAQTNFHAFYRRQAEKYGGADFDNVWMIHNCIHSRPSALLAFGGAINYGNEIARDDMVMGREISTSFWIDIKPIDRLLIENNYNYVKRTAV